MHIPKGGPQVLYVQLQPNIASKRKYDGAILNGLEIFKANDTTGNLAGPNPLHTPVKQEIIPSKYLPAIFVGVIGGVAALYLLYVAVFVVFREEKQGDSGATGRPSLHGNSHPPIPGKKKATQGFASSISSDTCHHFSFAEITAATSNFDEALILGVGGFGKVYMGVIKNRTPKVVIKRGNPLSKQGVTELGFCDTKSQNISYSLSLLNSLNRENTYISIYG